MPSEHSGSWQSHAVTLGGAKEAAGIKCRINNNLRLRSCWRFGALAAPVAAQDPLATAGSAAGHPSNAGFYGGVVLRQGPQEGPGVQIGNFASAWGKFVPPTADETGSAHACSSAAIAGRNDLAVEAAFATVDRYALAPSGRGGVGLALASPGDGDRARAAGTRTSTRAGRSARASRCTAGWATRSPTRTGLHPGDFPAADPRRTRDGMNYGVGLRYDMTPRAGSAPRVRALRPLRRRERERPAARIRPGPVRHAVPVLIRLPSERRAACAAAKRFGRARCATAAVPSRPRSSISRGCARRSGAPASAGAAERGGRAPSRRARRSFAPRRRLGGRARRGPRGSRRRQPRRWLRRGRRADVAAPATKIAATVRCPSTGGLGGGPA